MSVIIFIKGLFWWFLIEGIIFGTGFVKKCMWPTLEKHVQVQRKAASTNTIASIILKVVKDNYTLEEDGLHVFQPHWPVPGSEIVVKSHSVKRNAKNAWGLGRNRAAEPVRIFLTACSSISAPDIPSDWSIVTVNIIT